MTNSRAAAAAAAAAAEVRNIEHTGEMPDGTFSSDEDDEWLGFNDIFSPAPLVPPGAETFEFALPNGRTVRAAQSVAAFPRRWCQSRSMCDLVGPGSPLQSSS